MSRVYTFPGHPAFVAEAADALGVACEASRLAAGRSPSVAQVADLVVQALAHGPGADVSDTVRRVRELAHAAWIAAEAIERMLALITPAAVEPGPAPKARKAR